MPKRFYLFTKYMKYQCNKEICIPIYCDFNGLIVWYFCCCMQEDLRYPRSLFRKVVWTCINKVVEPLLNCWPVNKLLRYVALRSIMNHIHYEDETTEYICACPINKVRASPADYSYPFWGFLCCLEIITIVHYLTSNG